MSAARWFGAIALVYSIGLSLFASHVASSLIQNDIGAVSLRYEDSYATLPISAGACSSVDTVSICRASIGSVPLTLRYKLASPLRTNLWSIESDLCSIEFADKNIPCGVAWVNHPDRKAAFATLTSPAGGQAVQVIQREWPMQNLPESTWINLAQLNVLPTFLALWFAARRTVRGVVPGLFLAGLVALVAYYATGIFGMVVLRHLVD